MILRRWIGLLALTVLAGCTEGVELPSFAPGDGGLFSRTADIPETQVVLAGGALAFTAPYGYCIDGAPRRGGTFVVIASCQILTDGAYGPAVPPGIMTITVGDPDPDFDVPSPGEISELVGAPLLFERQVGGASYVHLASGGDARLNNTDPRHWRAFALLGDRPVLLTLYAPEGGALATRGGTALLIEARNGLRSAAES